MTQSNRDIAKILYEIADLLEIQDGNPFRIRAYRNGAQLVGGWDVAITDMLANNESLTSLPGIGKDLAAKIGDIARTGSCDVLETLHRELPSTLTLLLKVPGLGPKRVQTLYQRLDVSTPEQVYAAAKAGEIRRLPGFGEKIEATIAEALANRQDAAPK